MYYLITIEKTLSDSNIEEIINLIGRDTGNSKIIDREKIKEKDYILDPKRYLNEISFKSEIVLKDIVLNIDRGSNITMKKLERYESDKKTKYRFLNLVDIQDGRILDTAISLKETLVESNEEFAKLSRLKKGQLVISRTGSPIRIAVVEDIEDEIWFFSGNIYAITLDKEKYNPYYLKGFLESKIGQELLNQISVGSIIPNISIRDLNELKLPNTPMEKQNEMENLYLKYNAEIIKKERELKSLKSQSQDKIFRYYSYEEVGLCD